jgi:outer membrane lipoprotein-sorting protein
MPLRGCPAVVVLALCFSLWSSSCVARRRLITRKSGATSQKLITADKQTLLARIAETYRLIDNFNATVDMVPALGSTEKNKVTEYKDVRGYILFRKPAIIRIIGLFPVVRNKAFDMVSNGSEFRLYLPTKNRFVVGKNEIAELSPNRIENLRPQHFLDALLVRPAGDGEMSLLENYTDEDNAAYIVHIVRKAADSQLQLARTVWFDRFSLLIVRQIILDPAGNILTDARYSDWQRYDNIPFPKHIEINRPQDEYAVVLTVVKMDIDKGVSEDKFVLERPEGSVLQVLGEKKSAPPK